MADALPAILLGGDVQDLAWHDHGFRGPFGTSPELTGAAAGLLASRPSDCRRRGEAIGAGGGFGYGAGMSRSARLLLTAVFCLFCVSKALAFDPLVIGES